MFLEINHKNPDVRKIKQVVQTLHDDGVIIYPTDTIYGFGCDISNKNALERICKIKGIDPEKTEFSFICESLSQVTDYSAVIDNVTFRLMKHHLPGPFTFILKGNNALPKILKNKRKTIGIRIPDNPICMAIVQELGRPLLTTSLKVDDKITPYLTDPTEMYEVYQNLVDIVIDGGMGGNEPSTVIDCTTEDPKVIRQGLGQIVF